MAATSLVPATPSRVSGAVGCPVCGAGPLGGGPELRCPGCRAAYSVRNGVLDLRPPSTGPRTEEVDWSEHWSAEMQESFSQRFFSVYRKLVFARAVRYFLGRYFPKAGLFLEAGSGTSETSMLVDKHDGARTLVALDLIPPVLERCHPVMDVRVAGDIFRLPFLPESIDGVWNVGVMEHFTHDRIDAILGEFRRVLKPGGRIILLWPAVFSAPQRMLRIVEFGINLRRRGRRFRFHPDEISQLRSIRQGREVLRRNGFRAVAVDPGFRTLMAFETLVGEKPL